MENQEIANLVKQVIKGQEAIVERIGRFEERQDRIETAMKAGFEEMKQALRQQSGQMAVIENRNAERISAMFDGIQQLSSKVMRAEKQDYRLDKLELQCDMTALELKLHKEDLVAHVSKP